MTGCCVRTAFSLSHDLDAPNVPRRKLEAQLIEKQAFRRGHGVYDTELEEQLKRLMSMPCKTLNILRGTEDTEIKTVGRLKFQTKLRVLEPSWKDEKGMTGGFKLPPGDSFEEVRHCDH